ncbi:inner membrane-spanning protein YciB [Asticcacaulis sp. YBE204]|uniref:inner membrane-spanning protein YciB n=1 Tax=Asticcacaulis sp. YBE204 TaxID=1282363 RepID=UPI0003C3DE85|nr:septation protein IspZ [Asticcacaulis sp. YBE204]ESQ81074.1 septation protein A [Asticcacaulis sp. YBE204]
MSDPKPKIEITEAQAEAIPEVIVPDAPEPAATNWVKSAIDFGPVVGFAASFFIFKKLGIGGTDATAPMIYATDVLIAVSIIALIAALIIEKRIAWIPLVATLFAIPMGLMTIFFHDPVFIKVKVTVVNVLIGGILGIAALMKKYPLKSLLGSALNLRETAWPTLTWIWVAFYGVMAVANEVIWRTQSDDLWVTWKLGSMFGGPVLLTLILTPFLMKNIVEDSKSSAT